MRARSMRGENGGATELRRSDGGKNECITDQIERV